MIISVISFLIVFTTVVLVHEMGHFLTARKAGVKVYEFSIGFPFTPKIVTLFRHRETEFTLRLLPLGGFVSFSRDGDEDARDLFGVSSLNRALILSAGSLFNIGFAFLIFILVFAAGKHLPLVQAILSSVKTVWSVIGGTIEFLVKTFSGQGSWEGLAGPVGIAALAGKAAAKGLLNIMYFTGMLSLSLGIINLIPFPALDGGQLVMLLIETIRKKPLSVKTYQAVNLVGFALFILLSILVTYKDVVRLMA
ncbi:MAG: site-2 protease family protein [Betaproteobacteria bacterium]